MRTVRTIRGIGVAIGSVAGAIGVVKQTKKARARSDGLLLVNAVANGIAVVTGLALAVRAMRKGNDEREP